jgi:hypothetical protein
MKTVKIFLAMVIALAGLARLTASGPLGIYGIVEKVVFEADEKSPQRIQVWGAFAYAEGGTDRGLQVSAIKRGYLYFQMQSPPGSSTAATPETVRKEWLDLKSVAGTGQAVGFGQWFYMGGFGALQADKRPQAPSNIVLPRGGPQSQMDLRVRPAAEPPSSPATYETNAGVVKLSENGSHADLVKLLKAAVK